VFKFVISDNKFLLKEAALIATFLEVCDLPSQQKAR
jgi:hypothetical protein